MKTAEEILDSKDLHWTYFTADYPSRQLHDTDCTFCRVEDSVLKAMEEYASQFKAKADKLEEQAEELRKTLLKVRYICQVSNGKTTPERLFEVYKITDKELERSKVNEKSS